MNRFVQTLGGVGGAAVLAAAGLVTMPKVALAAPAWSVAPSPNTSEAQNHLFGMACAAADECFAGGSSGSGASGAAQTAVILENTGNGWGFMPSPSPYYATVVTGLTCVSTTDCWAVGYGWTSSHFSAADSFTEHWDGSSWTTKSSPNTGVYTNLNGVACTSSTNCYAVGDTYNGAFTETQLILQWNGTSWSTVLNTGDGVLNGVACPSVGSCHAVGATVFTASKDIIEDGSGSSWTESTPDASQSLLGVTCTSTLNCWAVGSVIDQWNGATWSNVQPASSITLYGVSCTSATNCWAAGVFQNSSFNFQVMTEQYNGTSWSNVIPPSPASTSFAQAIACDGTVNCWFVGYTGGGSGPAYTLIEQAVQSGAPPFVTSLSPAAGPTSGGQVVTVHGYNFASPLTVMMGTSVVTASAVTPTSFQITTPSHAAGYVNLVATDTNGSSLSDANSGYLFDALSTYTPLTPFRILDTRSGSCVNCGTGVLLPAQTFSFTVGGYHDPGTGQTIPTSATAAVLNVTAVSPTASGYLTVSPHGTGRPVASNVNFTAGAIIPNLVTVSIGQGGVVDIYNFSGNTNVVVDVEGYYSAGSGPQGAFHTMPPLRVCDTRNGQPANGCNGNGSQGHELGGGQVLKVNVSGVPAGVGGSPPSIPTNGNAEGAVLNITAVSGNSNTFLSVFPTGSSGNCATGEPSISTINVQAGAIQADRVFVALGPASSGGPTTDVCVYNLSGSINFILDANGWFGSSTASGGTQFQPIGPTRICDTRTGNTTECTGHALTPGFTFFFDVAGVGGVSSSAVAVSGNLTGIAGNSATFFTAFPEDASSRPNASDLNMVPGEVVANATVVQLSSTGAHVGYVSVFNLSGTSNLVFDVSGWFQ